MQGSYCHSTLEEVHHETEENKHHPKTNFIQPCAKNVFVIFSIANVLDENDISSIYYSIGAMVI